MEAMRILFCAESVYQLFNAITLRMTECAECDCDIILSTITVWNEDMLERLEKTGVFGQIIRPATRDTESRFWELELEEKLAVLDQPEVFFLDGQAPIQPVYDAIFCPIDHVFWKMLYYFQTVCGHSPRIFMYDEGVRAYTMELPKTDQKPYLEHEKYQEAPFVAAIEAYYLYQPDLYAVKDYEYELRTLPNPAEYPEVKRTLLEVYSSDEPIEEPFIYLEDFFFADRCISNDFALFEQVAALVGKENLLVKRHPRDDYNRFEAFGYKTMENSVVPWEIQLLANDLSHKVLVSVSSTSILTPYIIFDADMHVISLEKMFIGENPTHADRAFDSFFTNLKNKINMNGVRFHTPANEDELERTLKYIAMLQQESNQTKKAQCAPEAEDEQH